MGSGDNWDWWTIIFTPEIPNDDHNIINKPITPLQGPLFRSCLQQPICVCVVVSLGFSLQLRNGCLSLDSSRCFLPPHWTRAESRTGSSNLIWIYNCRKLSWSTAEYGPSERCYISNIYTLLCISTFCIHIRGQCVSYDKQTHRLCVHLVLIGLVNAYRVISRDMGFAYLWYS